MAANILTAISGWSTTAGSNQPDSTDLASTLREDLQAIQAAVRYLRSAGTIASASTTNLATVSEEIVSVSGTTTITALGTVSAGMVKTLVFEDALTLTHNGTSLILENADDIVTTAGDAATFLSLGSGNWRLIAYHRATNNGTWTPVLTFATAGNLSVAYTTQAGRYIRAGKLVTVSFNVTTSSFTHTTASGALRITGLPFTAASVTVGNYGNMQCNGITASGYTQFVPKIDAGAAIITFGMSGSGVSTSAIEASHLPTAGLVILHGSITYQID